MNSYVIKSVRRFYGGKKIVAILTGRDGATVRFGTPKDARARVTEIDAQVHRQMVGEYGRPVLSVVREDKLPKYLKP